MPYCVAAALVHGRVGLDSFEDAALGDARVRALLPHITMTVEPSFDHGAPALTQARVRVRLRDGRELVADARGARGYPERPASSAELRGKFLACAERVLPPDTAAATFDALRGLEDATELSRVFRSA
jgi:2-methylcitrate dehydratase PrpD